MSRKEHLIENIIEANFVYSKTGENFVADNVYEEWIQELKSLDPNHSLLTNPEPVSVSSLGKVIHKTPMLSLNKVYSIEELKKWMNKVARNPDEVFEVSPKYDGIFGRLNLSENSLSTRGNGTEGEDISDKISEIQMLILSEEKVIDGELLITYSDFENNVKDKLSKRDGTEYKTPRNAVAGLLNQDRKLPENVITFVPHNEFRLLTTEYPIENVIEQVKRLSGDYPTDGLVIKLTDEEYGKSLGSTSHHPKHSMALKHDNESAWTRLIDVEFQMAKDTIGMVGIVEPTVINNVTIQRVTLHNMDVIESLDLRIGDEVLLERAGDVIPHILESKPGETREKIHLEKCPSCDYPVFLAKQFYRCPNDECEDKIVNRIDAGLKDLGSKGIAKETIRKIYKKFKVTNLVLLVQDNDISSIEGFGNRSVEIFNQEIQRLLNQTYKPEQVFATLNIHGIGQSMFKKIFKVVTWQKMLEMSKSELSNIPQMGPERANELFYTLEDYQNYIPILTELFKIKEPETSNNGEEKMETVVFTGKGNMKREEYDVMAEELGYSVGSSVTKETTLLVCADVNSGSSKLKKAEKNGIKIISYDEFEGY